MLFKFLFMAILNTMTKEESLENERKRLIFRSWHRGTREMDLILGSFANKHVPGFSAAELDLYAALLHNPDPDLYNWITGVEDVPDDRINPVMDLLLTHDYAANRTTASDETAL